MKLLSLISDKRVYFSSTVAPVDLLTTSISFSGKIFPIFCCCSIYTLDCIHYYFTTFTIIITTHPKAKSGVSGLVDNYTTFFLSIFFKSVVIMTAGDEGHQFMLPKFISKKSDRD